MARAERSLDGGPAELLRFAADLRQLRHAAGSPPYRQLAGRAHYSPAALAAAAGGRRLPSLDVTLAYVQACDGDTADWERRWRTLAADLATDTAGGSRAGTDAGGPPYVGLAPFQPADAGRFFGREQLVTNLLRRVEGHRFVGVFGASGAGKSSVLRAGLVPRWSASPKAGPVVMFTPGPHPLEECALRLAAMVAAAPGDLRRQLAEDRRGLHWIARQLVDPTTADGDLLIVVDQFEEVFTLCTDCDERSRFIEALLTAARAENSRCRVVIGVRADFYGHCTAHRELVRALDDAQVAVGPMSTDELRRAITQPAARAQLTIEGALLVELVGHAYGRAGVLPLLSHALVETWRRRRGNTLTLAGYQATGGIDGALANTAESAYRGLDAHRQAVARDLFARLAALGDGTEDTRRRISRDDLDSSDEDVRAVIEHFVGARLVTVDQSRIEITHEVLIRCWPRLRRWLTEDRDGLRLYHELTEASRQWEEFGRDPAVLYRGVRLAAAHDWVVRAHPALTSRERAFLDAGLTLQDTERADARRRGRRLRRLVAVLTGLLMVATGTTIYAAFARATAARQRDIATAQNVAEAATALRPTEPALANQLLLAAYRLAPTTRVRGALLSAFALPYAIRVEGSDGLTALATTRDGRTMATAGTGGTVHLMDLTDSYRPATRPAGACRTGQVTALAFHPTGRLLACGDRDGTVRLWDTAGPQRLRALLGGDGSPVLSVAFSGDGARLAAAGPDRLVTLWDVTGAGQPRPAGVLRGHTGTVRAVAFSPGGRVLASAGDDGAVLLWDAQGRSGRPVSVLTAGVPLSAVAVSPDGRLVAAAGRDGALRVWNVADPARPRALGRLVGHTDAATAVAFSPDSRVLASGSVDATVRLWDVRGAGRPGPLLILGGHVDEVTAVGFAGDGHTLVSVSRDRTTRLWDVPGNVLAAHTSSVYSVAATPDGRTVATASYDRTVRLWDVADADRPRAGAVLRGHAAAVNAAAFSPTGRALATGSDDGTARLWDVAGRSAPGPLSTPVRRSAIVHGVAFAPDGAALAAGAADGTVTLADVRDAAHPRPLATVAADWQGVWSVAFNPDGDLLAAGGAGGAVSLWDTREPFHPRRVATLSGHGDAVRSVAFHPDGRTLVTASEDRTVRLWDVTNPRRAALLTTLSGYTDGVESVAFSPDGRLLATASSDRTVRLFDVADRRRVREFATLTGHGKPVDAVTFSRDGRSVLTGSEDWTTLLWRTSPEDVARRICATAYPPITRAEWRRYLPGIAYHPPCRAR